MDITEPRAAWVRTTSAVAAAITLVAAVVVVGVGVPPAGAGIRTTASGAITGRATVTGTPAGTAIPALIVQMCPASELPTVACDHQVIARPQPPTGKYRAAVAAGTWRIAIYYSTYYGQIVLSQWVVVKVAAGATVDATLTVAYRIPAARGSVTVPGAPGDFTSHAYLGVQACPGATFAWDCKGGTEAYENIRPGAGYAINLSPGSWTLAAYYHPDTSTAVYLGQVAKVTSVTGKTVIQNLSVQYQGLTR